MKKKAILALVTSAFFIMEGCAANSNTESKIDSSKDGEAVIENSIEDSEKNDFSSYSENSDEEIFPFIFWEEGNDIESHVVRFESGEYQFEPPIYLKSKKQLEKISEEYPEFSPGYNICSPFDGSEPKYIVLNNAIYYYFSIPDRENCYVTFMVPSEFSKGEAISLEKDYEIWREFAKMLGLDPNDVCAILPGDPQILRLHIYKEMNTIPESGTPASYYRLCWADQKTLLSIDYIPDDSLALLESLVQWIQEKRYT